MITIKNQDCMQGMKELADRSINLVITDPPYNEGYSYEGYEDNKENYWEWTEQWLKECHRVISQDGNIFVKQSSSNLLDTAFIMQKVGFIPRNVIVWTNRSQANPHNYLPREYEVIIFMSKSQENYFNPYGIKNTKVRNGWGKDRVAQGKYGDLWDDIKRVTAGNMKSLEGCYQGITGKKIHSCQMPLEIVKRILLLASKENDNVLDPFAGSGTTALGCKIYERNCITFEISKTYIDLINFRLKEQRTVGDFSAELLLKTA